MKAKIYHNPRCSKSRATLALLMEHGLETEVIEYLRNPLQADEIKDLLSKLGIGAAALLRSGEAACRDSGLSAESPTDELIELMVREPIVIERPIVVIGAAARIGRPPERVLELID
jgi:arsenate reductase